MIFKILTLLDESASEYFSAAVLWHFIDCKNNHLYIHESLLFYTVFSYA